jgi:hypothetical protein
MLAAIRKRLSFSKAAPTVSKEDPSLAAPVVKLKSQDSSLEYFMPHQTLIIFDYDDSLCPSNWIRRNRPTLNYFEPCPDIPHFKDPLGKLEIAASNLLKTASHLGKVVIVTNAQAGWVEVSCRNFMPLLLETIQQLKIEVVYARTTVDYPEKIVPQAWKETAMKNTLNKFYSDYAGQSWKNTLSIGDQICDREALKAVTHGRPNPKKVCRTKTIKLREEPNVHDLISQIDVLQQWIKPLVYLDNTADLDLGEKEDFERILHSQQSSQQ